MPQVDMPLAELWLYRGTNPRPADFDAYWTAALQELDATPPAPELRPAAFQARGVECFDIYFSGVRGARLHARYLRPAGAAPRSRAAVLRFHGYRGKAGDWYDKLPHVLAGASVLAMDCRGQGGESTDPGGVPGRTVDGHITRGLAGAADDLLFRQVFLDTAQLARVAMLMPEVNPERLATLGASQGGALALVCAALEPRVRRVVSLYPFLCDYERVWRMDLAEEAYADLRSWFRLFDPLHEREREVFTRLGYIDIQHLAPRVRGSVLMAATLMDKVCPPSTQFAAYNSITAPKELLIYPDFAHEGLPGFMDRAFTFLADL